MDGEIDNAWHRDQNSEASGRYYVSGGGDEAFTG